MIKSITNSVNGFFDRYDTNKSYLSDLKYPEQNIEKLGKWNYLRYKTEYDNIVNNRYKIVESEFPQLNCGNSGESTLFQILRYDKEEPYKVILRNDAGEIIVTSVDKYESILEPNSLSVKLFSNDFRTKGINYCNKYKGENKYINYNISSTDEFFNEYNNEFVNKYPIQDDYLFGRICYIEFYNDLFRIKATDMYGTEIEVYEDENGNIVNKDGSQYYKFKYSNNIFIILLREKTVTGDEYFLDINGNRLVKLLSKETIKNYRYAYDINNSGSDFSDLIAKEPVENIDDYLIRNVAINEVAKLEKIDVKPLIDITLMEMYENTDSDHNTILFNEDEGYYYYADNGERINSYEDINREFKNRFIFSNRMKQNMIKCDSSLAGRDEVFFRNFYPYYNVYAKSIVDLPRREYNTGIIIRADINGEDPQVVVMFTKDGERKYVCQDEAKFFIDTNDNLKYYIEFED